MPAIPSFLRRKAVQYSGAGFLIGLALTLGGYAVDYYSLYAALPDSISLSIIRALHEVTPVHFFTDGFALLLACVGGIAGWFQDKVIYHSNHLEDLVDERTEALRLAARSTNDGLWDWDLVTDQVHYSPRWKSALGYAKSEVGNSAEDWLGRIHPEDVQRVRTRIDTHLDGRTPRFAVEYRMRQADGSFRWMLACGMARREKGSRRCIRMAGSQTDIHERKQLEEQLMHMALHDPLTDLPNRTLLMDRLGHAFERVRHKRGKEQLAVVFLDIDQFKRINDSLGHLEGDLLLKTIQTRIKECLSGTPDFEWTLARMGGDEFILLMEDIGSTEDAVCIVKRIVEATQVPVSLDGRELFVTLSAGIAFGPGDYERPDDILRDSDTAMYRAKANGRGGYEVFDDRMRSRVRELLLLETDLRLALQNEQFHAVYQPIANLATGKLVGFEALLRWQHPDRGLIPPSEFIPLAEETGIINDLGLHIFTEACRQLAGWGSKIPAVETLRLAINLSRKQFCEPDLVSQLERVVTEAKLDPRRIDLEVTESLLLEDPEPVVAALLQLKEKGFRVAIDDFGTGHSSLATLHSLPVDILKIDRKFVAQLGTGETARRIVATIISLARALDQEVVAEGIETDLQLSELRLMGCELGQGHLLSVPLDVAGVEQLFLLDDLPVLLEPLGRPIHLRALVARP